MRVCIPGWWSNVVKASLLDSIEFASCCGILDLRLQTSQWHPCCGRNPMQHPKEELRKGREVNLIIQITLLGCFRNTQTWQQWAWWHLHPHLEWLISCTAEGDQALELLKICRIILKIQWNLFSVVLMKFSDVELRQTKIKLKCSFLRNISYCYTKSISFLTFKPICTYEVSMNSWIKDKERNGKIFCLCYLETF